MTGEQSAAAAQGRRLIRSADRASLATLMRPDADERPDGAPLASLVLVACGHDAAPILLLSNLSDHAKNIRMDSRISLLVDGTAGLEDPLTGPRLSLLGHAERNTDPALRARFLARHPRASVYADFADFAIYSVIVERAHLVAGFGRIHWLAGRDVLYPQGATLALAADEAALVEAVNRDEAAMIAGIAAKLLRRRGKGWRLTGIDGEGCDLRRKGETARIDFAERGIAVPVATATAARKALFRLTS